MAGVSLTPALTTTAAGLFYVKSEGYYQGQFLDDPAIRYQLKGGILKSTETLPMWGGIGIFVDIPTEPGNTLGGNVGRATTTTTTSATGLVGFSVFNQASNW